MLPARLRSSFIALLIRGIVLLGLAPLAGCAFFAAPPQTSSDDQAFPTPNPVAGVDMQPPPAWLLVGEQVVPATYGSFCHQTGCVDMVLPQLQPDLAVADLPAAEEAVIVIGSSSVAQFSASTQPWAADDGGDPANIQNIAAEGEVTDARTVFTLAPVADAGNRLLQVFVTFSEGGDASYLWRLNPAE